ncbi:30S ribosomal protein S11 [Rickettsiales endosymbiont of Trichoplax sp. H2]|uniref:30S ribosomal protein S11 n=1 Tax=Rickettsiales endosymbiont of Trichoplax sp. H2 TaxID=2021221 RepID=UPI0012B3C7F3|nr:30S ribosomal protein S11 [Rickettsiales endosymbiont of Trichoplax sp. H2]MSO13310.1 30S ribosomal protein S11 [Rickettsiales endosymbiont of Trichoplax sp. H2]
MKKSINKKKKNIAAGVAHISATFNNTIVTITDTQGAVVAWSSAGSNGFKGSRKSTPYAAQVTAENVAKKVIEFGMKTISVKIQGPGTGRDSAVRGLISSGLNVTTIKDITPIPHNGCRPPKRRRV